MQLDPYGLPGQIPTKRPGSNIVDWLWPRDVNALEAQSVDGLASLVAEIGAINATTGLSAAVKRVGDNLYRFDFTLAAMRLTVTDAAGSGSSASRKLWDFPDGKQVIPMGGFQNYTAFAEGAALTGAAGDAAFVMAMGSVAANAGDGALTGTEVDLLSATGTITLADGTGTGKKSSGPGGSGLDGSASGIDAYLNWSGSAATIDANSTIDVTGTIALFALIF